MKTAKNFQHIPAIVLGVDVSALNIVRSLGRKEIEVYVLGNDPGDYAAVSRYAKFVYCEDLTDEKKVVSSLLQVSRGLGSKMVLFCTADLHVLHVSKNRDVLKEFFEFVLPEHGVIETLMDKKKFGKFAMSNRFPMPATFFSENRADLQDIVSCLPYPCAVKPLYRTVYWSQHVPSDKKVMKVISPNDLWEKLEGINALDQPIILQEWIPGGDEQVVFCLAYINKEGKVSALFTGRKLRQYPSLTGVTSLAESIKNKKLAELTSDLFTKAGCRGLCSLECKYDTASSSLKITEPTVGRVDLQEGISTQAGLDIPFIAYKDAAGMLPSDEKDFIEGLRWINEPFELNSLLSQRRENGTKADSFFCNYKGPRSYALMSADDPRPFFRFVMWAGKRGLRYLKKIVAH